MTKILFVYTKLPERPKGKDEKKVIYTYRYHTLDGVIEKKAADNISADIEFLKEWYKSATIREYPIMLPTNGNISVHQLIIDLERVITHEKPCVIWLDVTRGNRKVAYDIISVIRYLTDKYADNGSIELNIFYSGWHDNNYTYNVYLSNTLVGEIFRMWKSLDPKFIDVLNNWIMVLEKVRSELAKKNDKRVKAIGDLVKNLKRIGILYLNIMTATSSEVDIDLNKLSVVEKLTSMLNEELVEGILAVKKIVTDFDLHIKGAEAHLSRLKFYKTFNHIGLYILYTSELLGKIIVSIVKAEFPNLPKDIEEEDWKSLLGKIRKIDTREKVLEEFKDKIGDRMGLLEEVIAYDDRIRRFRNAFAHAKNDRELLSYRNIKELYDLVEDTFSFLNKVLTG